MIISPQIWLAPLRGVTIRTFRKAFSSVIQTAGFTGVYAPFIPANPGIRVNDHLLTDLQSVDNLPVIPQVITKDPASMRILLQGLKARGFNRVDLNAGCPFPMIRKRGRGSGLMRTPDVLERLLETGCDEMGAGNFSLKIRLGIDNPDELLALMPRINRYPLAILTIHARTAHAMYEGDCNLEAFNQVASISTNPVMYNGDLPFPFTPTQSEAVWPDKVQGFMIGRSFVRSLATHPQIRDLLRNYIELSREELYGDRPVLGRIKELLTYWNTQSIWQKRWPLFKMCRTTDELLSLI